MKTQRFLALVSVVLTLNFGLSQQGLARTSTANRSVGAALCTAILAFGTAGAVAVTKVMGTNPQASWTSRLRNFNDRHALLVFLGNAIGGRFADKISNHVKAEVEVVESASGNGNDIATQQINQLLASGVQDQALENSIHFVSFDTQKGVALGYFKLNQTLARFEITTNADGTQSFIISNVATNTMLVRGSWQLRPV